MSTSSSKPGILKPKKQIELFSGSYFAACTLGGIIACGPTHTSVTPLDLVKCRRQVSPGIYKSNLQGWQQILKQDGVRGVFLGWSPTFIGYSFQGAGKYGAYELFKYYYGEKLFPNANKTVVYLGASATAEFIADIFLCPFEAIKVRMQTTVPPFARTLREGMGKVIAQEGYGGLYKGLVPLWGRQIPYTMIKFSSFEAAVSQIYKQLGHEKESYGTLAQTGVSFLGGYIAGIGCAVGSHPADVMVSKLNSDRKPGEGAGKAMSRIYSDIGFKGLWNGLPVRIVMIGTLTAFQWLIYDSFKVSLGVSTEVRVHENMADKVLVAYDWWTLSGVGKSAWRGVRGTRARHTGRTVQSSASRTAMARHRKYPETYANAKHSCPNVSEVLPRAIVMTMFKPSTSEIWDDVTRWLPLELAALRRCCP